MTPLLLFIVLGTGVSREPPPKYHSPNFGDLSLSGLKVEVKVTKDDTQRPSILRFYWGLGGGVRVMTHNRGGDFTSVMDTYATLQWRY